MALGRTVLWIWLFSTVYETCCSPPSTSSSFSCSLSLTRAVRSRVQRLLLRYKEEQLGDKHFENKRSELNTLPSVTINYRTWLQMEDTERLYRASRDLQIFWSHLESQRQQLQGSSGGVIQKEMKENRQGKPYQSLSQSILGIQLDLRDLMRQVQSQLLHLRTLKKQDGATQTPPPSTTPFSRPSSTSHVAAASASTVSTGSALKLILSSTHPSLVQPGDGNRSSGTMQQSTGRSVSSQWVSSLEGYVILRDLERYLSRLVRDYTLLNVRS